MFTKTQALERFLNILQHSRLSPRTVQCYSSTVSNFLNFCEVETTDQITLDMGTDFLLYLIESGMSPSSIGAANSALRRFYEVVLSTIVSKYQFPKLRTKQKPTPFFTPEQVRILIMHCQDLRLRAAIILGFECGMRSSEVVKLRFEDIDKQRQVIRIWNSKRNKSRVVPYSPAGAEMLNAFYSSTYRPNGIIPSDYIFQGRSPGTHLSASKITQNFREYVLQFDFACSDHRFHSLRHSFASAHCRMKTDIYTIAKLLGHSSIQTTMKYIHMDSETVSGCPVPTELWTSL